MRIRSSASPSRSSARRPRPNRSRSASTSPRAKPGLRGDPARLQQVFWNLLRNAIKFTPAGGRVTIRTRDETGGRLRVQVSDSGIGIQPEALLRIFHAFEQAGAGEEHRFGGLGLGLAIAHAIVDLHDGTIRAESAGLGQGATFVIELPGAREQPSGLIPLPLTRSGAATPAPPVVRPLRLLLVEDHEPTLTVLGRLLTRAGHHVTLPPPSPPPCTQRRSRAFDVVISDLGLPDGTGLDLLNRLLLLQPRIRAIALSGYGMEEDLRRSVEAGFFAHLVKPVDFDQLRRVLREVVPESAQSLEH